MLHTAAAGGAALTAVGRTHQGTPGPIRCEGGAWENARIHPRAYPVQQRVAGDARRHPWTYSVREGKGVMAGRMVEDAPRSYSVRGRARRD